MLDEVAKDSSLLRCIINHLDKGWDDTDSADHNEIFSHLNGLDIHNGNHCSGMGIFANAISFLVQ